MSKKKALSRTAKLGFAKAIVDMSTRGDMDSIVDSLRGYWRDKSSYPWHRLYATIASHSDAFENDQDLENTLMRIRDGLFGALDLGSLSLPLQIHTSELLNVVLSTKSWVDGRRKARAFCADLVAKGIEKAELEYLTAIGLEIDGMAYMLPSLKQQQLEQYRDARPQEKDGKYDLKKMVRSVHGHRVLRAAGVTQTQLGVSDPRAAQLLESYEHLLVELELDVSAPREFPQETLQTTLNGDLVEEVPEKRSVEPHPKANEAQKPLTEFMAESEKSVKKKAKAPKESKKESTLKTKTQAKRKRKGVSPKK